MNDLLLTIGFDDQRIAGKVTLFSDIPIPNLHEYFISPAYEHKDDGTFEVVGYSLVHRTFLPPAKVMAARESEFGRDREAA